MRVFKFFAPDDALAGGESAEPAALTVDTAVAALQERREKEAKDTTSEARPEAKTPDTPEVKEIPADNSEQSDDEKLATELAKDRTTDTVELPSGWSKANEADLALWNALTPEAQNKLRDRERQRDEGIKSALQKSHETEKAAAAERETLKAERQKIAPILNSQKQAILQQIVQQFPEVDPGNPATLVKLALEHPERKVAFDTLWNQLGRTVDAEQRYAAEMKQREDTDYGKFSESRVARLKELDTSLNDPKIAEKFEADVLEYLTKGNPFGAVDVERIKRYDAVEFLLVKKAMLYDRAMAALKVTPPKETPKVMKPGAAREGGKSEEVTALGKRLKQTGDIKDAVALLRARRTG